MKYFGEQHFANVAYINFDNNERMKALFEGDFDVHRLLLGLYQTQKLKHRPFTSS